MKKNALPVFAIAAQLLTASVNPAVAQGDSRKEISASTADMGWWHKARFGMFIHWGVYSVPAGVYQGKDVNGLGEWIMQDAKIPRNVYAEYARRFNPDKYDPEAWVSMAKAAGMKYIVITAKHHDGFALFDSEYSDWTVVKATPYGKDLLKPLVDACRRQGMKLGLYYSQANDWYHPGGAAAYGKWDPTHAGSMDEYIDKVAVPQVREILTKYGDIVELWWDVPTDMTPDRAAKLHELMSLQPGIITNDRLGGGYKGDITTPEQYIPPTGIEGRSWETCMTMNDTWGFKSKDENWKSSATLIRNLVDIASKGGNYLLNVGPEASGAFPAPIVSRLKDIGAWMDVNGEAIYGTTASPFKKLGWGRATKRIEGDRTTLYLHVFNWPKDGQLFVPGLKTTVRSAQLLAGKIPLKQKRSEEGVTILLPVKRSESPVTVIRLGLSGKLVVESVPLQASSNGAFHLSAALADIHNQPGDHGDMGVEGEDEPNIGFWTDANDHASWDIQVKKPGTYSVKAIVAVRESQTGIILGLNGKPLFDATLYTTGEYSQYREVALGNIEIPASGIQTISVKAKSEGWNPVNIREITLKPVN